MIKIGMMAKHCFLITIEITSAAWEFKKGDKVVVPVFSNHATNALKKFENKHWGSEYPGYKVVSIDKENWLFCTLQ